MGVSIIKSMGPGMVASLLKPFKGINRVEFILSAVTGCESII